MQKINIELTEEEAIKFRKYMENYDTFNLLCERGVFNIKNGSAVLDFDSKGILRDIRFSGFLYSSKHDTKRFVEPQAFIVL